MLDRRNDTFHQVWRNLSLRLWPEPNRNYFVLLHEVAMQVSRDPESPTP